MPVPERIADMKTTDKPSAWHTGKMRSALARRGVPPEIANELVRMDKTRKEISEDIIAYIRSVRRGR